MGSGLTCSWCASERTREILADAPEIDAGDIVEYDGDEYRASHGPHHSLFLVPADAPPATVGGLCDEHPIQVDIRDVEPVSDEDVDWVGRSGMQPAEPDIRSDA